ncbi:MAG: serine/threonine-protein kinase [Byssovorax sp.]
MTRRPAVASPFQAGDMIAGKYRVERELGRGGMGVVFAALHVELEQQVAVKLLHASAAANPDFVARFSREARSAAKIRSEHVARMIDVGTLADGTAYFVMEYLEGEDLAEALQRRGALAVPLAVDYVLQACEAVAAAHAAGIIHRDIKPANLFIARNPDRSTTLKVLDFGVAKVTSSDPATATPQEGSTTQTGHVLGSPLYMSPEQLQGSARVDARADIWALGVVLYELLTNTAPFAHGALVEIFAAVMRDAAPPLRDALPDAPAELEHVILRCLAKKPGQRYANVAEMARALLPFGPARAMDAVERMERLLGSAERTMDAAELVASGRPGSLPDIRPSDSGKQSPPDSAKHAPSGSRTALSSSARVGDTRSSLTGQHALGSRKHSRLAAIAGLLFVVSFAGTAVLLGPARSAAGLSPAPSVTSSPSLGSMTAAPPPLGAPDTALDAGSTLPASVALSIDGVPPETRIYRGVVLLGTVPGIVHLPRGADKVTLRFAANNYSSAEVELVPDADRRLTVSLMRAPIPPGKPVKPRGPSDLERF